MITLLQCVLSAARLANKPLMVLCGQKDKDGSLTERAGLWQRIHFSSTSVIRH